MPHRAHQLDGVRALVLDSLPERGRTIPGVFGLLDEVGAGKTKQTVDAGQILYLAPKLDDLVVKSPIDTILALTPGFARSTWAEEDPLLGEVSKHAWPHVPNIVHEWHGDYTDLDLSDQGLHWIVSNFEFVRRDERRDALLEQLRGRRTWVIVDESWCIKGNSDQTRACIMIRRKRADRATILNGTPLADGKPMDLYYQFKFLDEAIIGVKNVTHFRSKYCVLGGFNGKQVVGYQNLDELNRRIAPYILTRRTRDCFDLPPMLDPITVEARLTDETWKLYRSQRDEMVTWLGSQVSMSKQGITKALRLAQICSGFLGGLEDIDSEEPDLGANTPNLGTLPKSVQNVPMPSWLRKAQGLPDPVLPLGPFVQTPTQIIAGQRPVKVTKEVGREKLDAYLRWLKNQPKLPRKLLTWCRFRPELERMTREMTSLYATVANLRGGQTPEERSRVKSLLAPGGDPRPAHVIGITGTGAASLNFSAASLMVFMSHDPALIKRTQSIGRIERPGQKSPMLIVDMVATGPKGQKTIDHHNLKALRGKDDMSRWTIDQWRKILAEE